MYIYDGPFKYMAFSFSFIWFYQNIIPSNFIVIRAFNHSDYCTKQADGRKWYNFSKNLKYCANILNPFFQYIIQILHCFEGDISEYLLPWNKESLECYVAQCQILCFLSSNDKIVLVLSPGRTWNMCYIVFNIWQIWKRCRGVYFH